MKEPRRLATGDCSPVAQGLEGDALDVEGITCGHGTRPALGSSPHGSSWRRGAVDAGRRVALGGAVGQLMKRSAGVFSKLRARTESRDGGPSAAWARKLLGKSIFVPQHKRRQIVRCSR